MDTMTKLDARGYTPEGDNSHLDARDRAIGADTLTAWQARAGGKPRVGDFVRLPNGNLHRCAHGWDWGMQTCRGGSFFITTSGGASMSGSLCGALLWEYYKPTPETKPGRFWFFSHNVSGAGRGVDLWLPCTVYDLQPFTMTEDQARAHPEAKSSSAFWGENHREHLSTIFGLMLPTIMRHPEWWN